MTWIILLLLICALIMYVHPWIDFFTDEYTGKKHTIIWFTDFTGNRKYIDLHS